MFFDNRTLFFDIYLHVQKNIRTFVMLSEGSLQRRGATGERTEVKHGQNALVWGVSNFSSPLNFRMRIDIKLKTMLWFTFAKMSPARTRNKPKHYDQTD